MSIRGIVAGGFSLIVLYVFVTPRGSSAASGIAGSVSGILNRILDPTIPGISDRASGSSIFQKGPIPEPGSVGGPVGGVGGGHQFPSTPTGPGLGGPTPRPI